MKNNLYLCQIIFTVLFFGIIISLSAQGENRNLIQIKFNFNYFKEDPRTIYWYTPLVLPDISYKRFFKNKQCFFEFEFDNVYNSYNYSPELSDVGKPRARRHFLFEEKLGAYLVVTPRLRFFVKGGAAYRKGAERRVTSVRQIGGVNFFQRIDDVNLFLQ